MVMPAKRDMDSIITQTIFHGGIAEIVERLHAVDAQHIGQRIKLSASQRFGIIAGNGPFQLSPR
jgi:hypothetical protein